MRTLSVQLGKLPHSGLLTLSYTIDVGHALHVVSKGFAGWRGSNGYESLGLAGVSSGQRTIARPSFRRSHTQRRDLHKYDSTGEDSTRL